MTIDDFKKFYWITAFQRRDMLIEELCLTGQATTDSIRETKNLGAEEHNRRKSLSLEFVECPYCKGYHNEFENTDKLCEKCEYTVHITHWDKEFLTNNK